MKKKTSTHFGQFTRKKSNAAIKEQFKQEKRKYKKEREEYFDKKKAETRAAKPVDRKTGTREAQPVTPITHARKETDELMPLNKFMAHCGVSGRREAAELIKQGKVKVNNEVVTEPGHRVSFKDDVKFNGKKIFLAKNLVYILLNKPKDYITTTSDPQNRKTVLDIVGRATTERVYPVGRLDRNTSGVLLLTNDGELAQKLTHPSNEVRKIYAVTLDKALEKKDFEHIVKGVMLEDGMAMVDVIAYPDIKDKTQVGLEIHSGRNRVVRRIFEALGYDVKALDRVSFAGLSKKNVERGKFRFLTEKEVRDLKYFKKGK